MLCKLGYGKAHLLPRFVNLIHFACNYCNLNILSCCADSERYRTPWCLSSLTSSASYLLQWNSSIRTTMSLKKPTWRLEFMLQLLNLKSHCLLWAAHYKYMYWSCINWNGIVTSFTFLLYFYPYVKQAYSLVKLNL